MVDRHYTRRALSDSETEAAQFFGDWDFLDISHAFRHSSVPGHIWYDPNR